MNPIYAYKRGPKRSKYKAVRTIVDGVSFASKKEAARFGVLKIRERIGEISDLALQPRFKMIVNDVLVCTYVGDFAYREAGEMVCEDVKGVETDVFKLKCKLLWALHGVEIKVT